MSYLTPVKGTPLLLFDMLDLCPGNLEFLLEEAIINIILLFGFMRMQQELIYI
jgi:hypothetical protein